MPNFYAQKDLNGYPIPGTMMSTNGAVPTAANIITIAAQDVSSTTTHPSGLVFFVGKDINGNIIPNSLVITKEKPKNRDTYEHKKS
jgi:hypothetical protein